MGMGLRLVRRGEVKGNDVKNVNYITTSWESWAYCLDLICESNSLLSRAKYIIESRDISSLVLQQGCENTQSLCQVWLHYTGIGQRGGWIDYNPVEK
jgi:hypothetical protein